MTDGLKTALLRHTALITPSLALALALTSSLLPSPARSEGGAGSGGSLIFSPGGADNPIGPGGAGSAPSNPDGYAGGGGGAGVTGGSGAAGGNLGGGAGIGGTGGASAGAAGLAGGDATADNSGSGGGGGGAHGFYGTGGALPGVAVAGGAGGAGGSGGAVGTYRDGGGAGAGGFGAVLDAASGTLGVAVSGGAGGAGGTANATESFSGSGGSGGLGLLLLNSTNFTINAAVTGGSGGQGGDMTALFTGSSGGAGGTGLLVQNGGSVTVNAAITGGNGGTHGFTNGTDGADGAGGVGIIGSGLTLVLSPSATIIGGVSGDGLTQADAIQLNGAGNRLELQAGATILGNVQAGGVAGNVLVLGGATNGSFNASLIGPAAQYRGFTDYEKSGAGTWILTGAGNQNWAIVAGTLQGDATSMAGNLSFASGAGSRGAVFDEAVFGTYAGTISGDGSVTKTGAGAFNLTGTMSHTGATSVQAGIFRAQNDFVLSSTSAVTVAAGATLDLAGYSQTIGSLSGAGAVTLGIATLFTGNDNSSTTFSGVISEDGDLVKIGSGTLTLTGANTYSGTTTISAGALAVGGASALGTGGVVLAGGSLQSTLAGATLANPISLAANATVRSSLGDLTLTGPIALDGNTLTAAGDAGTVLSISGIVSGTGGLSKIDPGTLTLSGANTYTGSTNVNAGRLILSGGSALSDIGSVSVAAGASLELQAAETIGSLSGAGGVLLNGNRLTAGANGASTSYSGIASGTGGLSKSGAGVFTLSGTHAYTGATTVDAGTLVVNGSIATSAGLTVAAGATIAGSGALPSTTISGTLAPGNSPGTLTVNGNLTLNPGSSYVAEIQGAAADRVNVTGAATLAGTLRIVPLGGAYLFSSPYTLLSAAAGRTGTFSPVETTGSFGDGVTTSVAYTTTDVQLTLTPKPLAPIVDPTVPSSPTSPQFSVGRPENAYAVASAIDRAVANGADPSALFAIYNLPAAAIPAAVNQLSGEVHTAVPAMANNAADQFLRTMLDWGGAGRLSGQPGGPAGAASFTADLPTKMDGPGRPSFDPTRFSVWGATFGSTGRNDGDPTVGSANRTLYDGHVAVGADIRLGTNTVIGAAVAGGQSRASLSAGLGKAEADVFQAGLYGQTRLGTVNLAAALAYANLSTDTTRSIPALGLAGVTASYTTQAWSGRIEASLPVVTWSGITLSPLAAFQAVRASSPSAVERDWLGVSTGTLNLARRSDMVSRSELGLQLDANLLAGAMPVTGFVRAAWAHYYQRDADLLASLNGLPGASFAITGARPDRNSALLAAGADIRLSPSVRLGMRVDSELSSNTHRIGGTAKLSVSF